MTDALLSAIASSPHLICRHLYHIPRISHACRGSTFFTREQLAIILRGAYKDLTVNVTTLRSLGNFKEALVGAGRVCKIRGITIPRSFELTRYGPNAVRVGMKEFMHSTNFTGMSHEGVFAGAPPTLFKGAIPYIEDAPPFELKEVDPEVIRLIRVRYKAVHPRVDHMFAGGEWYL